MFHLSMKEGSLFCIYEIHWTGMLQIVFLVSLESFWRGGVHGLGSMTFGLAMQMLFEYSTIFSLKMKLNCSWKFWMNWNVPLVLLGWAIFNGIYLVRFGFKMWEIMIFEWFLLLRIQINSKKLEFWKEKSVENVVTLESLPFNSSMISFHIWLFKKSIHTLRNNVHMLSFPIL